MPDFSALSLGFNLAIFAVAAVLVWLAGTKLAGYADELAQRFGLSQATVGLLLLALVTSLPEIATSFTAARAGNAELAVNNLFGSIAMQVAVLGIADMLFGKRALTSVVPDPIVLLQGAFNVCLLTLAAIFIMVGDVALWGAGAASWGLFAASLYAFWKLTEASGRRPWVVNPEDPAARREPRSEERPLRDDAMKRLLGKTLAAAGTILVAGFVVATCGEAIAEQSGLGSSFVGVALVAIATSLPEASTVFASMRRGLYTMAISDILGTNIFNITLLFMVDLLTAGEPVLSVVGTFAAVGAMLGVAVTGLFMVGLAERADRTIGRIGVDSLLVLLAYAGGLVLLYSLRGSP